MGDSQLALVRVMGISWKLSVSVGFLRSTVYSFVLGSSKVDVDSMLCALTYPVRSQLIRVVKLVSQWKQQGPRTELFRWAFVPC